MSATRPPFWIVDRDGNAIPFLGSRLDWAVWMMENRDTVRVGDTEIPHARYDIRVSTIFLGTSTHWPLFETMVIAEGSELNLRSERSITWPEARLTHLATVEEVSEWAKAHP